MYLLDTNVLIEYLAGEEIGRTVVDPLLANGVAISVITYLEAF